MSLVYLNELPINGVVLSNTIPLTVLIIGLVEFLVLHAVLDSKRIKNFFSWFPSFVQSQFHHLKVQEGKESSNLELSNKQSYYREKSINASICRREMEMVFKSLGIFSNPKEAKPQERLDSNDLFNLFEERNPTLDEVKEAFNVFDQNKDGYIDARELQRVMPALGLKEGSDIENCRRMIMVHDENNDGRIDFDEFVKFMENSYF